MERVSTSTSGKLFNMDCLSPASSLKLIAANKRTLRMISSAFLIFTQIVISSYDMIGACLDVVAKSLNSKLLKFQLDGYSLDRTIYVISNLLEANVFKGSHNVVNPTTVKSWKILTIQDLLCLKCNEQPAALQSFQMKLLVQPLVNQGCGDQFYFSYPKREWVGDGLTGAWN
ncbi:unnamed protein product [Lactuca saligna]|uniref:Uncharacterized protein n=1 Tax=Lactuca saligna TaxID=75948 RepID=A0AA35V495_LACSI|nr:unnamed protein product [Lactuca saligna]